MVQSSMSMTCLQRKQQWLLLDPEVGACSATGFLTHHLQGSYQIWQHLDERSGVCVRGRWRHCNCEKPVPHLATGTTVDQGCL